MKNLFNIDIDQIKHNGSEVLLMKLNGDIIYEVERGYCIEYTVMPINEYLFDKDIDGKCCYGIPRIYSEDGLIHTDDDEEKGTYSFNYSKIAITKTDGTVVTKYSDVINLKCNEISKVILWYPETTQSLKFYYPFSDNNQTTALKEVNYCNTSNFVSMKDMFSSCYYLTAINNVDKWETSNVTDMSEVFAHCSEQIELDVSKLDTSKVINMHAMFATCANLTELDVSSWDTGEARSMSEIFYNCKSLTSLDVNNWDTSNVEDMDSIFYGCESLTQLDINNWSVDNVVKMEGMFGNCVNLTVLDMSNWITSKLASTGGMFYNCTNLTTLYLNNFDLSNTSSFYMENMFYNCVSLRELHLDNCNTDTINKIIESEGFPTDDIGVTRTIYCKKSQIYGVACPENWIFSYVYEEPDAPEEEPEIEYYMEYTVDNNSTNPLNGKDANNKYCYGLPRIYTNADNYSYDGYTKIEIIKIDGSITEDTSTTCDNISSVRLWYPEETYTIKFYGSSSYIPEVNTIKFYNTPEFKTGATMFYKCDKLTSLDLSNWDAGNITEKTGMTYMLGFGISTLTDFKAPKNINASIDLSGSTSLTYASLKSVINNLATVNSAVGYTLTLGTTNKNKLMTSDIDIAKNKGWTIY